MTSRAPDLYSNLTRIDEHEARIRIDLPDRELPLALGVELPGGYMEEVVPSGVSLPHTTSKLFSTAGSFQMAAEFNILLGNRPLARDNVQLCRIRVRNIKWSGAGVPQIDLRFNVNEEGLLTMCAANLDRDNAEIVVFLAREEVSRNEVEGALADARAHEAEDQATRELVQKMLECYALVGATNDYYSAAKRKMGHGAKTAYKQARKRLEKALAVEVRDADEAAVAELDAAAEALRAQRRLLLPLYKRVMNWYR